MKAKLDQLIDDCPWLILAFIPLLFTTGILFLKSPMVWPDEAIYADTVKTYLAEGRLATGIFGGAITGLEKSAVWYPPLYFHILAYWIRAFGSSIEAIRALSLIFSFLALITVFYLATCLFRNRLAGFLAASLVSLDIFFAQAARVGRMDMLSFLLISTGLLLFVNYIRSNKPVLLIAAGGTAALSVLNHPLGFILPVVISACLLLEKKSFKARVLDLAIINSPVMLAFSLWMVSLGENFPLFLAQYGLQFARKALVTPFIVILFQQAWHWQLLLLSYLLITVALAVRLVRENRFQTRFIMIGLLVSSAALNWGREMWYFLYFQPFIALAATSIFASQAQDKSSHRQRTVAILIMLFIAIHIRQTLMLINIDGSNAHDYHDFGQRIGRALPHRASVFIASIPDPYFDLQFRPGLKLYEFPTVPVETNSYRRLLDKSDYIIYNYYSDPRLDAYIRQNTAEEKMVSQPGGYEAKVIKLVPRDKRKWAGK